MTVRKPKHHIVEGLQPLAVEIARCKPLEGNPRTGDVKAVAKSLAAFGQRKPIVARADTGTIVAGNHTWQAARSLKWTHVAVVFVDDDDSTAAAYAVADNRVSELGSVDQDAVARLLAEIDTPDLLGAVGYAQADLDTMLSKISDPFAHDSLPDGKIPAEPDTAPKARLLPVTFGTVKLQVAAHELQPLLDRFEAYVKDTGSPAGFLLALCR